MTTSEPTYTCRHCGRELYEDRMDLRHGILLRDVIDQSTACQRRGATPHHHEASIPIVAICSASDVGTWHVHRYDFDTKEQASELASTWTPEMSQWLASRT